MKNEFTDELKVADLIKGDIINYGKTNTLYGVLEKPEYAIFCHGDMLADNNSGTRGEVPGKGALNCELNALCFSMMKRCGIPTHFIDRFSENETLIYKVTMLPFEVVIRNASAGSFAKTMGIPEGTKFTKPLLEITKKDAPRDITIADEAPVAAGWITESQYKEIQKYAEQVNAMMTELFARINYQLVDFKLEFGILNGRVVMADEFSFDTCRVLDENGQPVDKTALFASAENCERQRQAIASIKSQMEFYAESQKNWQKFAETGDEAYVK